MADADAPGDAQEHHGPVADADAPGDAQEFGLLWSAPAGPAPLVNQFYLQALPDGDGGPGEIVCRFGYAMPTPNQAPDQPIVVTNVASFSLTRHRAEQLLGFLREQIGYWDQMNEQTRGGGDGK